MSDETNPTARRYKGVMVSSTFLGLEAHRAELMKALEKAELFAIGMEKYVLDHRDNLLSSSLRMVGKASAYVGLISHRYGQVIESAEQNPRSYSVSRLEFEEAQRLGLPTLVFVMGDEHPVKKAEVEIDPGKVRQLEAYRERAKEGRLYVVFNSLEEFTKQAIHAVERLARALEEQDAPPAPPARAVARARGRGGADAIPSPPDFYAEPPYIGSHDFVGRAAELERLSDWAAPADPHPVLLFEAIGGAGKSMLTWEWVNRHSADVRRDWAGRFWYSFYERGAIMADFCRRALAYITGRPLEEFRKKKTIELGEHLLFHLKRSPWLLVLDGLERVLVAYHRFDAAQVADDQVDTSTDQIAHRDPCAAIRPEDDDLLRTFAAAAPSKLLITTRLTPRVLLNPSGQSIQGVQRVQLHGLRPADAEQLLRSCGVNGDSQAMQDYLKRHCDCHPLVTGVLAGLINNHLPDRGNFDAWAEDPAAGGHINLAALDLVQKRNHILLAALADLPDKSRQLLSTLALLSESVDYPTLLALNPHFPPEPEEVFEPGELGDWGFAGMSDEDRKQAQENYQAALRRRKAYEEAVMARLASPEFLTAPQELAKTVQDLERRGLLQYDRQSKRYDVHPVVRGVAAGGLRQEERERYGQRVVDHFSQQAHSPYDQAVTLDDVRHGLHIVRALLQMGRYQQACDTYMGDLSNALLFNLEANAEVLSLLRPFFSQGWATQPRQQRNHSGPYLATSAAVALGQSGEHQEALAAHGSALLVDLRRQDWPSVRSGLSNIASTFFSLNRLARAHHWQTLTLRISALLADEGELFLARLGRFVDLATMGRWAEAEARWRLIEPMGRDWSRASYRPGSAEYYYAQFRFYQGTLEEEHLARAAQLAQAGKSRYIVRRLHALRGAWLVERGVWEPAAESLHEAVRMAREIGQPDVEAEAALLLAKLRVGQVSAPREEAEQLAKAKEPPHGKLGELWRAMGEQEQAKKHALAAYKWAWADGEPYVHRHRLNKARTLLGQLGAEVPDLPPYDPAKDEKPPWEDEVVEAIEKLGAERESAGSGDEGEW